MQWINAHSVVANVLDWDIKLELQSRFYFHFRINTHRKGINPAYPTAMG